MKIGALWRRISRALTPPGSRDPLVEDDPAAYPEYQATLDKARLDALRSPDERLGDWQAPMNDH